MFATLNKSIKTENFGSEDYSQYENLTSQEIVEKLVENKKLQAELNLQNQAATINLDLANEIYALFSETEGTLFDVSGNNRYLNLESNDMPYQVLRRAAETEPARLIINKRRLELAQYAQIPTEGLIQRGSKFVFRNPDYSPTKYERALMREWERKIISNFFYAGNDPYPNFTRFVGNAYEDWFTLDDITIKTARNRLHKPLSFHLEDPILWKPVVKKKRGNYNIYLDDDTIIQEYIKDYETMITGEAELAPDTEPDYLLIYQNKRIAGATRDVIKKHHFFTRTNTRKAQRGYSVVEQGLSILTNILNSIKMNASNFTKTKIPDGILAFTGGGVGQLQLEKLKKILWAHMNGAEETKRLPMVSLNGEKSDLKWIGIRGTSRDMEYHIWMTLLFSIWCQLSGTDPREVSLGAHADAIKKQSLGDERTDGIVKESKDVGARTFLRHLEDSLNVNDSDGTNVWQQVTGLDIELKFTGFEIEDKKAKQETLKLELTTSKSLNEILQNEDKEKQTLMIGDINAYDVVAPNNEIIKAALQFKMQQEAQKQAKGQPQGSPGEGAQPAGKDNNNNLTDADKQLIEKYKDAEDVEMDPALAGDEKK